jgi:hypothetical protein
MKMFAPIPISEGATVGGDLIATNVGAGTDPAAYNAATTYGAGDQATSGDTIYQSLQAANTGNTPASSPTWWVPVSVINKLAMFDRRVGSQTVNADSIEVQIELQSECIDTISIICDAASVTVTQTDPVDGEVYTETQVMDEEVGDWWEYLYFPIVRKTAAVFTGLLPYRDSVITVALSNPGADAKCGLLAMGQVLNPGITLAGATDGITDYSVVKEDGWGVRDIVERDYADDAEFTVWVQKDAAVRFRRMLADQRAKPTVFILADERPDAQYYGLPSFRRTFSYPDVDVFTVSVKGFT